jgi:hypothetical protein
MVKEPKPEPSETKKTDEKTNEKTKSTPEVDYGKKMIGRMRLRMGKKRAKK